MQNIFTATPTEIIQQGNNQIYAFNIEKGGNIDVETVDSFGEEWQKFNSFSEKEISEIGDQYFDVVPSQAYQDKLVLDVGCGTGRWTKYVSSKARFVEAIDPSNAVFSAARLLANNKNTRISRTSVDHIPFPDNSFDFVFSLGVLHHIPDTEAAMRKCVEKLKTEGYFLVYLYYSLDNRGPFFKLLFYVSNIIRKTISKLPAAIKKGVCDVIAFAVYLPFVSITRLCRTIGLKSVASKIPLSWYADKSLNVIRNDALDRFGTPLERRFSKKQITEMMLECGLQDIVFSEKEPYWHAIGRKK